MKGTWQTTDSGGGIGDAVALIGAIILAVAVAGPVAAAVGELLRAVLIAAVVIFGLAVTAGAAVVAYRLRHRQASTPLRVRQVHPVTRGAAESLQAPRRSVAALPAPGRPAEVHLHFHGVSAEDVAAIVREHARENGSGAP